MWRSCDLHHDKFLVIKPTRCTDFSNLFSEWNSTCFGQFLCPSSGVFHYTHSNGICHTGYADCLLASSQHNQYDIYHCCPKHVEFHSENKFENLVHLVGYIIRNCSDVSPVECIHCLHPTATRENNFLWHITSYITLDCVIIRLLKYVNRNLIV